MSFRTLSVFVRKHTVNRRTHWLALALIAAATAALSGCGHL